MKSRRSPRAPFLFLWRRFLIVVLTVGSAVDASRVKPWEYNCSGTNYTPNSWYEGHMELLATNVPGDVSSSPDLFTDVTIEWMDNNATRHIVHALAQCRGDVSSSICNECVTGAFQDAQEVCPFKEEVVVLYDLCTVLLSGKQSLPVTLYGEAFFTSDFQGDSDFTQNITRLINAVTNKAASASGMHFATGTLEMGPSGGFKLYAVAQCVSELLSSKECLDCLTSFVDVEMFKGYKGGRASNVLCDYRWETYQFFAGDPMVQIPLVTKKRYGKGNKHHHWILTWCLVGAAVTLVVLLAVAVMLLVFFRKKRSSRTNKPSGEKSLIELADGTNDHDVGAGTVCVREAGFAVIGEAGTQKETAPAASSCSQLKRWSPLQSALTGFQEILELAAGRRITLFLDYDGTLSYIVADADKAHMTEEMRDVVRQAANLFHTSIVSGRGRQKVQDFVKIEEINYAGSHGLDIKMSAKKFASSSTARDELEINEEPCSFVPAAEYLPLMRKVIRALEQAVWEIQGATVEDNVFTVSVHYRNVDEEHRPQVEQLVKDVLVHDEFRCLKLTTGQMVWEVRPPINWQKGDAVVFLLGKLGLDKNQDVFPIYIGDDISDEDAFHVLRTRENGIGILVSEVSRETQAHYSVKNPAQVREFLELLVRWKGVNNESVGALWQGLLDIYIFVSGDTS